MMFKSLILLSVSAAAVMAAPRAEADPELLYTHGITAPNCKVENEEFVTQSCTPSAETVCVTNDIETEEIEVEEICKDVVSNICGSVPLVPAVVPAPPVAAIPNDSPVRVLKKREADPQFLNVPFAAPATINAVPSKTTVTSSCQEVTTKHCAQNPVVKKVVVPVQSCHTVSKANCSPIKNNIPKTLCEPVVQDLHLTPTAYAGYAYGK